MSFLRRLLGGTSGGHDGGRGDGAAAGPTTAAPVETDEVDRDRELLRADAARLENDLLQRQLRYADRAWTPPAQGGERRADDGAHRDDDGDAR